MSGDDDGNARIVHPVGDALAGVESARGPMRRSGRSERAAWLVAIADGLEASREGLVRLAMEESHLPRARLDGELTRTVFQAQLFAQRLREQPGLSDDRIDLADPLWPMGPRPDLRRTHVPIGPVAVFAASNFPFAFSVAGGDTVSALAAGCPVLLKAHPGHPELSRLTAQVVTDALATAGAPEGAFCLVEGQDEGVEAVLDRRIKAVAFTGSLRGGRALFDLAVSRPDPIPFYGELGSINPVVVTTAAWRERGVQIAQECAQSFTLGSGQFCTKPGFVLVPDARAFVDALQVGAIGPMLNERIETGYLAAIEEMRSRPGVHVASGGDGFDQPTVFVTSAPDVLSDPDIARTECFGPAIVVCEYRDLDDVEGVLELVEGTLTATVQAADEGDREALSLIDGLSALAGRVLWNEWPTGVTVSDAQQHGGPWPATTAPTTTSVGMAAIWRFLRPVAYQGFPEQALPAQLRTLPAP